MEKNIHNVFFSVRDREKGETDKIINQRTKMPFGSIKDFAVFLKYDLIKLF